MQEQRLTIRLMDYWNLIRKERDMPMIEHLNSSSIEDVWPQCFLISVDTRKGLNFTYKYMGRPITILYGQDLVGTTVDHRVKQFPSAVVTGKLPNVVSGKKPMQDEGVFANHDGKMVKYRACFLPFGNDKMQVTDIVVGLSFRTF